MLDTHITHANTYALNLKPTLTQPPGRSTRVYLAEARLPQTQALIIHHHHHNAADLSQVSNSLLNLSSHYYSALHVRVRIQDYDNCQYFKQHCKQIVLDTSLPFFTICWHALLILAHINRLR